MDGDILIVMGGFLTTWLTIAGLYYKMGKVEQHLKDLNGHLNKVKRR